MRLFKNCRKNDKISLLNDKINAFENKNGILEEKFESIKKENIDLKNKIETLEKELSNQRKIMMTIPDIDRVVVIKDSNVNRMNPKGFIAPENGWISFRATSNNNGNDRIILYVNDKEIGNFSNWTNTHVHTPFTWQLGKNDIFKATGGVWHYALFYPCKH
ncbi:hypothetical protein BCR32DRAFT_284055 [Anaeromyces robustus]|jgi:hypothetical protein|uniref:Uncharacterized protein n=1 Tax=Anaeromyces robustus TaxID=1754192 RepID=A0A1Y1WTD4_9FUNG|nr:hypothetical protein BCR32DRAFT_284055 [Anaeromyces robustus]|eukprot:ORX76558.1 hypothetical protein BCR32DRAFT_284055 [Anaeromyces robustus]